MLGNHPILTLDYYVAFFCAVFKEHKQTFGIEIPYGRLVNNVNVNFIRGLPFILLPSLAATWDVFPQN